MAGLSDLLAGTPFITRLIISFLLLAALANLIVPHICDVLLLSVSPILNHYHVWRIFTGWMTEPSIPTAVVLIWNMHGFLAKYELRNSSPVLLVDFFINGLFIDVLFFVLGASLYILGLVQVWPTMGALAIWLNFLVKYAYNNRTYKAKFFSVISIPLFLHPILVYLVCCVVSEKVRYDGLFAMGLAVMECLFFKSGVIAFTRDTYMDKQKFADKVKIATLDCWQKVEENKIVENYRLTVDSTQFYENLQIYDPDSQQEELPQIQSERRMQTGQLEEEQEEHQ